MKVEARNASLDTLAVTIQSLHVSGKQMTLAVFRQLPVGREREDSELWGVVRYAIKDEGDVWLVFSHDGVLLRRALNLQQPRVYRAHLNKLLTRLQHAEGDWSRRWSSEPDSSYKSAAEQQLIALREEARNDREFCDDEYLEATELYAKESKLAELTQLFIAV
jgi:hypothetical protein